MKRNNFKIWKQNCHLSVGQTGHIHDLYIQVNSIRRISKVQTLVKNKQVRSMVLMKYIICMNSKSNPYIHFLELQNIITVKYPCLFEPFWSSERLQHQQNLNLCTKGNNSQTNFMENLQYQNLMLNCLLVQYFVFTSFTVATKQNDKDQEVTATKNNMQILLPRSLLGGKVFEVSTESLVK